MQPEALASLGGFIALVNFACAIGILILVLRLLWRFVTAHEKMAASLAIIARKLKDEDAP